MNRTPLRRAAASAAVALSLALVAAACGNDDEEGGSGGEAVTGSVKVSGSSTVAPISSLVAEEFSAANPDAQISVQDPGTGDGFALFCQGKTDISDASRPIEAEEEQMCKQAGIEYIELEVGFDGMSVMTNPNNDAIECLSFADLYALIGPEAEGFETWADAQSLASELGSSTEFPDEELALTGPGTESGTYDSFIEIALTPIAEEQGLPEDQLETTRPDYQSSADDNVIVQNIEASDYSLGWVGFAYAEEAGDAVKEIPISLEPGGECVEPSADTIASGDYPLSRSLYIYVNTAKAEQNDAVTTYVDMYLENLTEWVEATGYVALPEEQASETMSAWEGR